MGSEIGSNGFYDVIGYDKSSEIPSSSSSPARSLVNHPSSPSSPSFASYIDHRVSKMDTLAGVAIKYGVEVADIRRLNGLSTDLQMYAHKTLRIPNTGKHPPSYFQSNNSDYIREQTPPRQHPGQDLLSSLQSLKLKPPRQQRVSQAMSLLHAHYNLSPPPKNQVSETKPIKTLSLDKDPLFLNEISKSEPPPNRHRKTRSLVNGDIILSEESVRRRQKADVSPEKISSNNNNNKPKGLPLRPKNNRVDTNNKSQQNLISLDSLIDEIVVRKSSSTSDLVDSDSGPSGPSLSGSIWAGASKWTLKSDSFAFPIFEGIPNPISSWRNKAAKD